MKPEIKFPTILGLVLLLASTLGAVILTNSRAIFKSNASQDCSPVNTQASNITANSSSIFFITEADCQATIKIDNRTIFDARQPVSGNYPASKTHYFQVNNLTQATNYPFQIISGGQMYEDEGLVVTTASQPTGTKPTSNLSWGKVLTPALSPGAGSILFMNIPGASLISAIVTSNGYWNIPLTTSFNDALNNWFAPPTVALDEEILVFATNGTITQLTLKTNQNNPVPDIILGQNYFTNDELGNVGAGQVPTLAPTLKATANSGKLIILSPKNKESISTQRPEIFGTANPGDKIAIKLTSASTFTGQTFASSNGSWTWHNPADLSFGSYALTVTASNTTTQQADTQSLEFTIHASSDSLAFTASESASLVTPTLIPTLQPSPFPTIQPSPTSLPTPVRTSRPSTSSSSLPDSGNSLPGIILIISSVLFITISLLFFRQSANFK